MTAMEASPRPVLQDVPIVEIMPHWYGVNLEKVEEILRDRFGSMEDWFVDDAKCESDVRPEIVEYAKGLTMGFVVRLFVHCRTQIRRDEEVDHWYVDYDSFCNSPCFADIYDGFYVFHADEDGPFGDIGKYDAYKLERRWEDRADREKKRREEEDQ